MPAARRERSWARLLRLLPAVAFVIALASVDASAAAHSDEHATVCKCGMHCRSGACCCGPRKPKSEPRPSADAPEPAPSPSGPCLGAAPCGDAVAAVKITSGTIGKPAVIGWRPDADASSGDRLPPPASDGPKTADTPRPDRPPRTDPSA